MNKSVSRVLGAALAYVVKEPAVAAQKPPCRICGAPSVESDDGHDDAAEPYCISHLRRLDPDAALLD